MVATGEGLLDMSCGLEWRIIVTAKLWLARRELRWEIPQFTSCQTPHWSTQPETRKWGSLGNTVHRGQPPEAEQYTVEIECGGTVVLTNSCPTLCDQLDCSMPGSSVLHYLPEFAQIRVHWVCDALQPCHYLLPPSSVAFNLSQYQDLFQWVSYLHQVAKVLEF